MFYGLELGNWVCATRQMISFASQELCITNTITLARSNPIPGKLNATSMWELADANWVNDKSHHNSSWIKSPTPEHPQPTQPAILQTSNNNPSTVAAIICHISSWPQYTFSHTLTSLDSLHTHKHLINHFLVQKQSEIIFYQTHYAEIISIKHGWFQCGSTRCCCYYK